MHHHHTADDADQSCALEPEIHEACCACAGRVLIDLNHGEDRQQYSMKNSAGLNSLVDFETPSAFCSTADWRSRGTLGFCCFATYRNRFHLKNTTGLLLFENLIDAHACAQPSLTSWQIVELMDATSTRGSAYRASCGSTPPSMQGIAALLEEFQATPR